MRKRDDTQQMNVGWTFDNIGAIGINKILIPSPRFMEYQTGNDGVCHKDFYMRKGQFHGQYNIDEGFPYETLNLVNHFFPWI